MSDYRGGYKNIPARFVQRGFHRTKYENILREDDLKERQAGIDRGEPNAINPRYAGRDTKFRRKRFYLFLS